MRADEELVLAYDIPRLCDSVRELEPLPFDHEKTLDLHCQNNVQRCEGFTSNPSLVDRPSWLSTFPQLPMTSGWKFCRRQTLSNLQGQECLLYEHPGSTYM